MPELPEVETVARGLHERLAGRQIELVTLHRPDLRVPFPENFEEILDHARIEQVHRRAKYLLVELDNGHSVVVHLGMSGTLRLEPVHAYSEREHDHVWWDMEGGERLIFRDPRRFGLMVLCERATRDADPMFAHLGPEPLGEAFTPDYLKQSLLKRSGAIKVALMDQKLVVGVGNIYASESLFLARIDPAIPAKQAAKHAKTLHQSIQTVLKAAIASGGSTLRDYVRSDGELGYFQHHFQVYDRAGEQCLVCSQPIRKIVQGGRSTFFCNVCQKVK